MKKSHGTFLLVGTVSDDGSLNLAGTHISSAHVLKSRICNCLIWEIVFIEEFFNLTKEHEYPIASS